MNRWLKNSIRNFIAILIVIGGTSYCTYNFSTAEKRVKKLCSKIERGFKYSELVEFALKNGLGPEPKQSGLSIIVESKTFGRWGCLIELERGVVKNVEYNYAD